MSELQSRPRSQTTIEHPDVRHIVDGEIVDGEIVDGEIVDRNLPVVREEGVQDVEAIDHEGQLAIEKAPSFNSEDMLLHESDREELERLLAEGSEPPKVTESVSEPTKLTFATIDQSWDARQAAQDVALERLTSELNEGGRGRRFVNALWKGNIAREFFVQKYKEQALAEIERTENIYTHKGTAEQRSGALQATIDRFTHEYDEVTVHRGAGEKHREIVDPAFVDQVKGLIAQKVRGELDEGALEAQVGLAIEAYREHRLERGESVEEEGLVEINNIVQIASAVEGAIEHGETLESVLENMRFVGGESRSDVRTEAHHNAVDKVIEKLQQNKYVSLLVSPEMITTAVSAASVFVRMAVGSAAGIGGKLLITAVPVGGAVGAGSLAALRENKRIKDERAQHSREKAQGKEFTPDSKRRELMNDTRYETRPASELISSLSQRLKEVREDGSPGALRAALSELGVVETIISMSDGHKRDLISFDEVEGFSQVSQMRTEMDFLRADLKVALRQAIEDPALKSELGLSPDMTLDKFMEIGSEGLRNTIDRDVTDKDKAFNKLKAREVRKAGTKAAVTSLVFSQAISEALAAASPGRVGLMDMVLQSKSHAVGSGPIHETYLYSMLHGGSGEQAISYTHHSLGQGGNLSLSSNISVEHNPDGTYMLHNSDGSILADHISAGPDGQPDPKVIAGLNNHAGMHVIDQSYNKVTTEQVHGGLHDFTSAHKDNTIQGRLTREWDHPSRDPNKMTGDELRFDFGGTDNNGILPNGKGYQLTISRMTPDGAYQPWSGGAHDNPLELARGGKVAMLISPSEATQGHPFVVPVDAQGHADVLSDNPASKFFSEHNGQAEFEGKYAEVGRIDGPDEHGVTHFRSFATEVGNNTAKDKVFDYTKPTTSHVPVYQVTAPLPKTVTDVNTAPGVDWRKPLERNMTPVLNEFSSVRRLPVAPVPAEITSPAIETTAPVIPIEAAAQRRELNAASEQEAISPEGDGSSVISLEQARARQQREVAEKEQQAAALDAAERVRRSTVRALEVAAEDASKSFSSRRSPNQERAAIAGRSTTDRHEISAIDQRRQRRILAASAQVTDTVGTTLSPVQSGIDQLAWSGQAFELDLRRGDIPQAQLDILGELKSGRVTLSEMNQRLRRILGAGGAIISITRYIDGVPDLKSARVTVTRIGEEELRRRREEIQGAGGAIPLGPVRKAVEAPEGSLSISAPKTRQFAIEEAPQTRPLEIGPASNSGNEAAA